MRGADDRRIASATPGDDRDAESDAKAIGFPLHEYRLRLGGREWSVLHTGEVLTVEEESRFLGAPTGRPPYGVVLWPAAIALAHDVGARGSEAFRGRRVLELGAGTGLPGIVAASLGAHVVQTDRHALAMTIGARNARRNGIAESGEEEAGTIEHRLVDWAAWDDETRYDWILGSDILYATTMHGALRRIFERNLARGGRVLLSDPFRDASLRLLETLEADGWAISLGKWTVGEQGAPRAIGVFEASPPA